MAFSMATPSARGLQNPYTSSPLGPLLLRTKAKKRIDAANYVAKLGVEAKQTNKNTHYIMVVIVVVVVMEGLGPSLRC